MTIEEAKNLIENYKLNKDNYLAAIQSFQNEEKEENYKLFLKLIGFFDTCCSDEAYRNIILILENFKNKLPSTSQNLGYYYYGESLLYLYLGDRARSIEFALEAKKIEGLDPKFLYYTECFLVSALYQEGLYKEALNENNFIYNNIYSFVDDDLKTSVLFNFIVIFTFLKDYDSAIRIKNELDEYRNKNIEYYERSKAIYYYINVLMILSFNEKYYSKEVVDNTILDYVNNAFTAYESDMYYSYLDLHIAILNILYSKNRKNEVYKVCKSYFSGGNEAADTEICKLFVNSIDKVNNQVEYVKGLEMYTKSLESHITFNKRHIQYLYEKINKYSIIDVEYSKLKEDYSHDALTKSLSRAIYDTIKKQKKFGSLIFIDINKLKVINDTYGHKYGDKYLIKFVENIRKSMPNDDVYRIGGDEFIVVSNDFDKDIIISKLNKLNKLPLYRTKIYEKFSAGVVINDRGISVSTAQEKADKLLYDIKNVSNVYYKFNK